MGAGEAAKRRKVREGERAGTLCLYPRPFASLPSSFFLLACASGPPSSTSRSTNSTLTRPLAVRRHCGDSWSCEPLTQRIRGRRGKSYRHRCRAPFNGRVQQFPSFALNSLLLEPASGHRGRLERTHALAMAIECLISVPPKTSKHFLRLLRTPVQQPSCPAWPGFVSSRRYGSMNIFILQYYARRTKPSGPCERLAVS